MISSAVFLCLIAEVTFNNFVHSYFFMPSYSAIDCCVDHSGENPSLSFHQIPSNKRKEIRQE